MPFVRKNNHWLLIATGTLVWSLTMVKSGWVYSYGMGFWGANGHDGIWHVSLINSLSRGTLQMPIFAGETIKNYHLGFDAAVALLHIITRIPSLNLYFQILPPVLAAGIGWSVYALVWEWTKSKGAAVWTTFFIYFGGSWGWVFGGGESMFWAQQGISTLINPPFALSLIILFLGLRQLHRGSLTWAVVLLGSLAMVKIYASVLVLVGLGVAGLFDRKAKTVFLGSLFLSVLLFLPMNGHSTSLLVWQPGWFLETMMGGSDRVNWPKFYSAMVNYKAAHNLVKMPIAYIAAFSVFVAGNLGSRVVGLWQVRRMRKEAVGLVVIVMIWVGLTIPQFVVQAGTAWNTIQFTYYSLALTGVLAGIWVSRLRLAWIVCVAILTVPTTFISLKHYLPSRPPAKVALEELEALNFLTRLPYGTILTYPVSVDAYAPAPRSLYEYESTAYVSALSGLPVFVEDYVNLNITGFNWQSRKADAERFFQSGDASWARQFLRDRRIKYIYLAQIAKNRPALSAGELGGQSIFKNSQAAVWQIN